MAKRFTLILIFISLSLSLCLMSNTYSRYVADATGNLEVTFSKWQILVNNSDITNSTSSSIVLTPVIEEDENIESNTFAPSSKGYFDIDIDPSNVGVSFDYLIDLNFNSENMPDLLVSKYSIINSSYIEGDEIVINSIENNKISGTLNYDKETPNYKFETFTIRVYIEWYEGENETMNDEADTLLGLKAASENSSLEISANIHFEQKIN